MLSRSLSGAICDRRQRIPVLLACSISPSRFSVSMWPAGIFLNVAEKRSGRGRGHERQVMIKRLLVDLRRDSRMFEDRFDFGSENEPAVFVIEVKRFDADAIANQHQLFELRIPKRDGVVAFDVVHKIEAAFFVEMKDRF